MTTKTTQELREAIETAISIYLEAYKERLEQGEPFGNNLELTISLITSDMLELIAKHEAELVEKVRTEVIGDDNEILRDTPTMDMEHGFLQAVVAISNRFRAEQRAKLTALTEKESKE